MEITNKLAFMAAVEDFYRARQQAKLQEIISRFRRERVTLLSYDEVRQAVHAQSSAERGIQEIPLDAIIGSVNRYTDFTRDFLPRNTIDAQRWARVEAAASEVAGWPPIEVYKIGEVYFVKDGNHRVSAARQIGSKTLAAYVTEVQTRVPLTADMRPEDLILKAEYSNFLEHTHFDEIRPEADLSVSVPGQYQILEEHIAVHRYFMGLDFKRDISYEEAVAHWYDTVYLPVIKLVRQQGILRDFPGRTETDMYLWISEHRANLENELGMQIRTEDASDDLSIQSSKRPGRIAARMGEKVMDVIRPTTLDSGPAVGQWRRGKLSLQPRDRLFLDILVPVNGLEDGWQALEMAIRIAQFEQEGSTGPTRLNGLHVVPSQSEKTNQAALEIQSRFNQRCEQAGISGKLILAAGEVVRKINERARWNDLVVTNLTYPPSPQPLSAITSGFRSLLQRCPRPLLAVPRSDRAQKGFSSILLAYDGSPKANEALFIAAYFGGKWKLSLGVVTVIEPGKVSGQILDTARNYLEERQVMAEFFEESGNTSDTILKISDQGEYDILLMGGYGRNPLFGAVIGSDVDRVLRESRKPILICR